MKRPGLFRRLLSLMKESSYHKKDGKVSSGRLSSWFILLVIVGANLTFIGIDIANAVIALYNKGFYEIPTNHIILYGMTLAHHLALLGINRSTEVSIEKSIQDRLKSLNQVEKENEENGGL